jgi:DNA adenine methylase
MSKSKSLIKSPLRYPGGKSRAINTLKDYFPAYFKEYREPFVGGGSVFIYLKQEFPDLKFWINDLNTELISFWLEAQNNSEQLTKKLYTIKQNYQDGKQLFYELTHVDTQSLSRLERAIRFFILNRITFSGTVESGGFSLQAFQQRFTNSSIERIAFLKPILKDVKITNLNYSKLLETEDNKIFTFLDPPYYSTAQSKLYGKKGNLHTSFAHDRFYQTMANCSQKWLVTYDNSLVIQEYFKDFYLHPWKLQYGMNNYKQGKAEKGQELIITNYPVSIEKPNIP